MDHTQEINFKELFSQLTTEEKLEAFKELNATDVLQVDEDKLAPSIPQARQLENLLRQYAYQHKMLEYNLAHCVKTEVHEIKLDMAKATGIVQILNYLISLSPIQPTQQESDPL